MVVKIWMFIFETDPDPYLTSYTKINLSYIADT
jgi:hypothetical protein